MRWFPFFFLAACTSSGGAAQGGMPSDGGGDASAADPGAITMQQVHVKDFVFDVRVAGPKTGEPVILLHGFPETSYEWRAQLEALGNAGYRAIAPDQRGYS